MSNMQTYIVEKKSVLNRLNQYPSFKGIPKNSFHKLAGMKLSRVKEILEKEMGAGAHSANLPHPDDYLGLLLRLHIQVVDETGKELFVLDAKDETILGSGGVFFTFFDFVLFESSRQICNRYIDISSTYQRKCANGVGFMDVKRSCAPFSVSTLREEMYDRSVVDLLIYNDRIILETTVRLKLKNHQKLRIKL